MQDKGERLGAKDGERNDVQAENVEWVKTHW